MAEGGIDREVRQTNLQTLYIKLPELAASSLPFDQACLKIHEIVMKDINPDDDRKSTPAAEKVVTLENILESNRSNPPGHFRADADPMYTNMGNKDIEYICPKDTDVPVLMADLAKKHGQLLKEAVTREDVEIVATWALINTILIHPTLNGNGRVARATYPLTLLRAGIKDIIYPETLTGHDPGTEESIRFRTLYYEYLGRVFTIGKLYQEQMRQGGVVQALEYERQRIYNKPLDQYWFGLAKAFKRSIQGVTLKSLREDPLIGEASRILKGSSDKYVVTEKSILNALS